MPDARARQDVIRLDFKSEQKVLVIPDNKDLFVITAGAAARACQQDIHSKDWDEQWQGFLASVHDWCKQHADIVSAGYVTIGDSALNALICLKDSEYNFELEDSVAELDLKLSQSFPLCRADVIQIPNQKALRTDLPPAQGLLVYGD